MPEVPIDKPDDRAPQPEIDAEKNKSDTTELNVDKEKSNNDDTNKSSKSVRSKRSNEGVKSSNLGGAKVKMPSTQLTTVTRAKNAIKRLQDAGSVAAVVLDAVNKLEVELTRLKQDCDAVQPMDAAQKAAKEQWMENNVADKEAYLREVQEALGLGGKRPTILINDNLARSNASSRSSRLSEAARKAAAEEAMLETERQRMVRRREQQEEERRLRLKRIQMQDEERRLQEQREQEDLEAKLAQARLRREFLEEEGLLQQALLPTVKLPTFKGEAINFLWFMRAFELQVEAITNDPARRLHLLLQHLQGEAYDLVRGCQLADNPQTGFIRAKARLQEEYGNPVKQTLAFKQKLLNWMQIKGDPKELRAFYTQLQLCAEVKLNGRMAELDSSSTLRQLMHKLPSKLQESWQRRACRLEGSRGRETTFEDFVQFIKEQSDAANHPVFGKTALNIQAEANQGTKNSVLATRVESEVPVDSICAATVSVKESSAKVEPSERKNAFSPPCLLCSGLHSTESCPKASDLPIEQRKEALRGLCFGCLQSGHMAKYCRTRLTCRVCSKLHPTVLHDKDRESGKTATPERAEETAKKEHAIAMPANPPKEKSCLARGSTKVALSVVPVKVWLQQHKKNVTVKAVLDNGSTATFVTQRLIDELGLTGARTSTELHLSTMTEDAVLSTQVIHGLHVCDMSANHVINLPTAYVVPGMPIVQKDLPTRKEVEQWPHLMEVPFNWEHEDAPVEMLIGMDVSLAQEPLKIVSGQSERNEPYAKQTRLGWVLNGPLRCPVSKTMTLATVGSVETGTHGDLTIPQQLAKLYYKEFEEAFNFSDKGLSQDDTKWLTMVHASVRRTNNGKYEIALPFRQQSPPLRNNLDQALSRLKSLGHKFQHNGDFRADYIKFIEKMEDGGYVEEVKMTCDELWAEASDPNNLVSYVVHHGVYHPRKPGKIRVVFNCSGKYHGVSLNDCLIQGPDLTSSLVGVLTRFREERIAFMADIEAMFYQVQVPERQRDALRYLWWPGGKGKEVKAYRLKVHLFGAASSPSCANYALRHAAKEAYNEQIIGADVNQAIKSNFYVDDCLKSMPDEGGAIAMAKGLIAACNHGGFKLAKFISPNKTLLQALNKAELASDLQMVDLQDDKHDPLSAMAERALGVAWKLKEDAFGFKIAKSSERNTSLSKRHILSKLSSLYDPLGFTAPVVIVARIIFRELTKDSIDWDEDIGTLKKETSNKWNKWVKELPALQEVTVPRCFRPGGTQNCWQLHVFCDASLDAYAAVAYLRQQIEKEEETEHQSSHVVFLFGKARVSPPKIVTVPRLELAAAKLAIDIAVMMQNELSESYSITQCFFWSDSQTVLKYLNNGSKRFHTYVANRVQSILTASCISEWRYVPTVDNPADDGTRGLQASELQESKWMKGPSFLKLEERHWPQFPLDRSMQMDDEDPEVKTLFVSTGTTKPEAFVNDWAERYSSMSRLKRAAWVLMCFKEYLQTRSKQRHRNQKRPTLTELRQAERALLTWLQSECWPEEKTLLETNKNVPKSSALSKLSPKLQDGLIVMESRTKVPLPIVPKGRFSTLLIEEAHRNQLHFGRQTTTAAILSKYWIIGLNKSVRTIIKRCPTCQRQNSTPQNPVMASLPSFRRKVPDNFAAFKTAGIDYWGPIIVKLDQKQPNVKMYGVIFTCAASRAVHLEAAPNLSSGGFLNALRRFVARRGDCKCIVSDNATNFDGANAEMQKALHAELQEQNQDLIEAELRDRGIEWRFNTPTASHHGGFFERLIRSVRRAMTTAMGARKNLTLDSLLTVLCEIEAVLNNRPITPVSEDPQDWEPLTPNHLLLHCAGPTAPPGQRVQRLSSNPSVRSHWRQVQHVANRFWRRWIEEYRVLLHKKPKWHRNTARPLRVNDVVLVLDPLHPREYWKLGRVERICNNPNAEDDEVRVVEVATCQGLLVRPVSKLCLLETASE